MTTITVSEALKAELKRIRDERELQSLEATLNHVLDHPIEGQKQLPGNDETLTEPIKVRSGTKDRVKALKEMEEYRDYEAVIRDKIGAAPRERGEEPIDIEPLDR